MNEKLPAKQTVSNIVKLLQERNMEEKAIAGLDDCLNATITMKDENGVLRTFPDFRTILGAITLAIAYTAGKPVERREVITRHATTLDELKAQAKASPELRRAVRELLDEK
jgi:hypothetical protein